MSFHVVSFHVPSLPLTEAGWVFALLFTLILVVPVLSQRARIPVVVGFVAAGTLVGPNWLRKAVRPGTT